MMKLVWSSDPNENVNVWTDYITTEPENQDQMWLPMNDISKHFYYDQRIVVCAQALDKPVTWKVSKLENFHPFGINKITLYQCKFDPNTDKKIDGIWYADYAVSAVEPISEAVSSTEITYVGTSPTIKIDGGAKKFIANEMTGRLRWSFFVDGEDVADRVQTKFERNACYVSISDFSLANKVLQLRVT
jgi:hypothetical protein